MFHRLAASLNIAFKWSPMIDQVQTFSSNILRYKLMFHRLATLPHKARESGKSNQSQSVFPARHVIISAGILTKCSMGSFIGCLIKHYLPFRHSTSCMTNTILDENVLSFRWGLRS